MENSSLSELTAAAAQATISTATPTAATANPPTVVPAGGVVVNPAAAQEHRVEVSIVSSPEVFGAHEAVPVTKSSRSPEGHHDERLIERYDFAAASPSDPRPPKKRYTGSESGVNEQPSGESPCGAQLPRAAPPPSAFCDARQVPTGEQFLQLLFNWQWVEIDNTQLPAVMRGGERFLAVHMVQLMLLSKFPPAIPTEIISRFTMVSHKMSTVEAWQFNAINAIKRKFDLGYQLFTTQDEIVRFSDVQMFYWNVKALNLSRIIQQYDAELQNTNGNLTLIATIQSLKNHVEADLERVRKELRTLGDQHQASTQQSIVAPSGLLVSNNVISIDDHHNSHHQSNGTVITSTMTETQHKDINVFS
ncbi:hypothetical protein KIN20_022945 [Parelaphostrongylus tenuis]|uniref:Uncharacterized protein n=1 Tax=Parelaphostrongylus tenuis TaxID=148309 RepID=A0AAD5MW57_PARTN|nr:hypothetical protein KIN20_022945 [Parelaphostrongylus tenuis]